MREVRPLTQHRRLVLEVIVQSVDDARAATAGGADRLEVVRDIACGGLTPPMELVRAIASETPLPLRVMVRENAGYGVTDTRELAALQRAIDALAGVPVDGVVAGFLRGGAVDLEMLQSVLDAAPDVKVTFHRAFDAAEDHLATIGTLTSVPQVDRILTSGGDGTIAERCQRLQAYATRAQSRLIILAGGGVGDAELLALTSCEEVREAHVGRAARENGIASGPVSADRVRRLRAIADGRRSPQRK